MNTYDSALSRELIWSAELIAKVSVLLLFAWSAEWLLRRRVNPRWRTFVWRWTSVAILVVTALSMFSPIATMPLRPSLSSIAEPTTEVQVMPRARPRDRSASPIAADPSTRSAPKLPTNVDDPQRAIVTLPMSHGSFEPAEQKDRSLSAAAAEIQHVANPAVTRSAIRWPTVEASLLGLWLLGVSAALARSLVEHAAVGRLVSRSASVTEDLLVEANDVRDQLGCTPFAVKQSREVESPCVVGVWRPVVLLPADQCDPLHRGEWRAVFGHEAAHVSHGDLLWNHLLQVVVVLLWFHPLAWRMRGAHADACDEAADRVAAMVVGDAVRYGQTLARIALRTHQRVAVAAFAMASPSRIRQRIQALGRGLQPTRLPRYRLVSASLVSAAACVLLGSVGLAMPASGQVEPHQQTGTAEPSAGRKREPADPNDPAALAGRFSGRVTDEEGAPIAEANVYLDTFDSLRQFLKDGNFPLQVRATTDAEGRFAFDAPETVLTLENADLIDDDMDTLPAILRCRLIAQASGYGLGWMEVGVDPSRGAGQAPQSGVDLALSLPKDDVPIHGRLLDAESRPFAMAKVRIKGLEFPGKEESSWPFSHWEDFLAGRRSSPTLWHFILESQEHERAFLTNTFPPGTQGETYTDVDGRFSLQGLGHDRLVYLTLSAPGVADDWIIVTTSRTPKKANHRYGDRLYAADFTFRFKPSRTVEGRVVDRATGDPIPGMIVGIGYDSPERIGTDPPDLLVPRGLPRLGVRSDGTVSDAEGRFRVDLPKTLTNPFLTAAPSPGMGYQPGGAYAEGDKPVVIECQRDQGIPYRLQVVDDAGRPIDAEVFYNRVEPYTHEPSLNVDNALYPERWAVRQADGSYVGVADPGPGAVIVRMPETAGVRSAFVDPKAFFEPERKDWTAGDRAKYGTTYFVSTAGHHTDQYDCAAILLIKPAADSKPLELKATLQRDVPRQVSVLGLEGKPVDGVMAQGLTSRLRDDYFRPVPASFLLTRLNPDRERNVLFFKADEQLIGFLKARGDSDTPLSVQMQPWASVTGRLLVGDQPARRKDTRFSLRGPSLHGEPQSISLDEEGRFRADQLVPGQSYDAFAHRRVSGVQAREELIQGLVLRPGEVRDLGDIQLSTTPRAAMTGRIANFDRRPWAVASLTLSDPEHPSIHVPVNDDGSFRREGLQPNYPYALKLQVIARDWRVRETILRENVNLAPGETQDLGDLPFPTPANRESQ